MLGPIGILGSVAFNFVQELFHLGPDTSRPAVPAGMEAAGSEAGVRSLGVGETAPADSYTTLATSMPDFLGGGTQFAGADQSSGRIRVALDAYNGNDDCAGQRMMEAVVGPDGFLRLGGGMWRCCVGRGGARVHKREGDGASPASLLALRRVLFRADRGAAPDTVVPVEPIGRSDGWCDDPADPSYNQPIRMPYPGRHEALWRDDPIYDVIGVLGWNDRPVRPGQGSAIFLHVARPDYAPTDGCVALAVGDLRAVLAAGLSAVRIDPVEPRG